MLRRSHRKSKLGCIQCKRRHRKCDETRPTCVVCSTAKIACSYVTSRRQSPESAPAVPQSEMAMYGSPSTGASPVQAESFRDTQPYVNILHLELFSNFPVAAGEGFYIETKSLSSVPLFIQYTLSAPYLMNEALALSALHLSVTHSKHAQKANLYREESTKLQSEALRLFNGSVKEVTSENVIPAFLFSGVLGLYFFCDAFTTPSNDLDNFLDKLVQSIRLFRGIKAMIEGWWDFLVASDISAVFKMDREQSLLEDEITTQLEKLRIGLLHSIGLEAAHSKVCEEAIKAMRTAYTSQKKTDAEHGEQNPRVVTAWPTMVSAEYTDLLAQRKPQALIILSYYAVLLDMCRGFWAVGNAGQILFQTLEGYLENHWQFWLDWPRSKLTPRRTDSLDTLSLNGANLSAGETTEYISEKPG